MAKVRKTCRGNMAEQHPSSRSRTSSIVVAGLVVLILIGIGIIVAPLVSDHLFGTPPSGTKTAAQTGSGTVGVGVPAQSNAESKEGKLNPAGQEDQSGGRAQAIQQTSRAADVSEQTRKKIADVIHSEKNPPRTDMASVALEIGASVPSSAPKADLPAEITDLLGGYQGDQYVLVHDKLVIVDQHSQRVTAIISGVG